jgi:hypothetical protein
MEKCNKYMSKKSSNHPQALAKPQGCIMWIKNLSKMMLEKEWLCNLFEMLFWNRFTLLSTKYTKKVTQVATSKKKEFASTLTGLGLEGE